MWWLKWRTGYLKSLEVKKDGNPLYPPEEI